MHERRLSKRVFSSIRARKNRNRQFSGGKVETKNIEVQAGKYLQSIDENPLSPSVEKEETKMTKKEMEKEESNLYRTKSYKIAVRKLSRFGMDTLQIPAIKDARKSSLKTQTITSQIRRTGAVTLKKHDGKKHVDFVLE